jgi:hypothetical protein
MSDETTSVWADIWAKAKKAFAWCASWVAEYPRLSLGAMIALLIVALF